VSPVPSSRTIAEGAARYREPGAIERVGARLARVPFGATIRRPLKRLYQAALRLQTRGRGLESVLPGGERVRVLPEYSHLSWNPDEYQAFRAALRPGATALDVGANVGAYSLLLGLWVGAKGRVFAFEPAAAAFDGLTRHLHLNGLDDVVRPVAAAVDDRESTARLLVAGTAGESRLAGGASDHPDASASTVPTISIDAFCAREAVAPDFIKIDIEGWELAALKGARETIRARGRSLALFVEMHPSIWPAIGVTKDDVLEELARQSLEVQPLGPSTDIWGTEGVAVRLVRR